MLRLGYLFNSIFIGSMLIFMIFMTAYARKWKLLKLECILTLPIVIILGLYYTNRNFNILVKSNVFAQENNLNYINESVRLEISLPPGSVWLFKTPTDIYYSKYSTAECKLFFDTELRRLLENGIISSYAYDDIENYYSIEVGGDEVIIISLIGDNDARRFGVLNIAEYPEIRRPQ